MTVAAATLASYPSWGTRLMAPGGSAVASPAARSVMVLDVHGMTCTAYGGEIAQELHPAPSAVRTDVRFEGYRAEIYLSHATPDVRPLIAAVERAGYDAQVLATAPGGERAAESVAGSAGHLVVLDGKLEPLIRDFNARRERPRFLAILSPKCPACVHGAGVIREVLLDSKPANYDVFIVWTPMVQGDDEAAARKAMAGLVAPHVWQYFDRSNAVGTRFRQNVFPKSVEEMRGSLPADHFFAEALKSRPSDTPEWDLYMFFDPGPSWPSRGAPRPDRWVRQVARFAEPGHRPKSLMWENSYADPPVEGELADQIAALALRSKGS